MGGYQLMVANEVSGRDTGTVGQTQPLVAGQTFPLTVDMRNMNHRFRGHRIMVQVQSSWFPLIDQNPQTSCPASSRPRKATSRRRHLCVFRSGSLRRPRAAGSAGRASRRAGSLLCSPPWSCCTDTTRSDQGRPALRQRKGVFLVNQQILVREEHPAGGRRGHRPGRRSRGRSQRLHGLPGLIDAHPPAQPRASPGNISTEGIKQITIEGLPLRALHSAARAHLHRRRHHHRPRPWQFRALRRRALGQAIDDGSVEGHA